MPFYTLVSALSIPAFNHRAGPSFILLSFSAVSNLPKHAVTLAYGEMRPTPLLYAVMDPHCPSTYMLIPNHSPFIGEQEPDHTIAQRPRRVTSSKKLVDTCRKKPTKHRHLTVDIALCISLDPHNRVIVIHACLPDNKAIRALKQLHNDSETCGSSSV